MHAHIATAEEHAQGYAICGCEKYAFVWKADWVRWFPRGYHGELCPECGALLEPVGRLAEIVGFRSIKWPDDAAVGEAAQAVALPRPETYP